MVIVCRECKELSDKEIIGYTVFYYYILMPRLLRKMASICFWFYIIFQFAPLPCHVKAESQIEDGVAYTCRNKDKTKIPLSTKTILDICTSCVLMR